VKFHKVEISEGIKGVTEVIQRLKTW